MAKKKPYTITTRGVSGPGGSGGLSTLIGNFMKPRAPKRPPSGSYDPILDAQERAAGRGILDLQLDTEQARERGQQDYNSAQGALNLGHDRTLADLLTSENRMDRQQDERARQSGVQSAGLLKKSDAVRSANFQQDRDRVNQDFTTNTGLLKTQYDRQYGEFGDLTTQLTRAQRENTFLGEDIQAQRAYQAAGTGWVPPKPKQLQGPNLPFVGLPKRRKRSTGGNMNSGFGVAR